MFDVVPVKRDIWPGASQAGHLMWCQSSWTFDVVPANLDIWCASQSGHLMWCQSSGKFDVVSVKLDIWSVIYQAECLMWFHSKWTFDVVPVKLDVWCGSSKTIFDVVPVKLNVWCTIQAGNLIWQSSSRKFLCGVSQAGCLMWCQSNWTFDYHPSWMFDMVPVKLDVSCTIQAGYLIWCQSSWTFHVPSKLDIWLGSPRAGCLRWCPSDLDMQCISK